MGLFPVGFSGERDECMSSAGELRDIDNRCFNDWDFFQFASFNADEAKNV